MKTFLCSLTLLAMSLGACANWTIDGTLDADERTSLSAVLAVTQQQISAWNNAGVDPLQMDQDTLLRASLACGTASALAAAIRPDNPDLGQGLGEFCATVLQAAGPAAPFTSPVPVTKPSS